MRETILATVSCIVLCVPATALETAFSAASDLDDWQIEVGGWRVEDEALLQPHPGTNRTAIWLPIMAYSDVDITVDTYVHPDGNGVKAPGIIYRARDQETYYYVHFDRKNTQVVWVRSEPGKEWADARRHKGIEMATGQWETVRVVCKGDQHEVYLDGDLLFTETDDTIAAGVIGLRAGQAKVAFRNLNVDGMPALMDPPFRVRPPAWAPVCTDAGAGAYEAFPDVCRAQSGELLCVFYAGYSHVSVPRQDLPNGARIALCRSSDDGATWSPAETVVDTPIDDRDPSITQLSNGDLLVTYMSYDPERKPGTHQVFTVRSSDGGRTWGEPQRVPTPFDQNEAVSEPVREMPDGRLLLPVYGTSADTTHRYDSAILESTDAGQTWSTLAVIRSDDYELSEPSLVRFDDGRLLVLMRPTMTWSESTDGGKIWTTPAPVGCPGDAPYLLQTSKGVLLCGIRHHPTTSTSVIASTDQGRTWGEPVMLDRVIGGYPSLVELPDGRVLVVYYTEGGGSDVRRVYLDVEDGRVTVLPGE